jgi:peptidoglycan/LPS O-acetylase OafA/YrhL
LSKPPPDGRAGRSAPRTRLSPRLIAGLDTARAAAACYVVAHHVADAHGWSSHGPGILLRFGQEAVLVFFLLSGFVIFANERKRALKPGGYFLRRLRRIYPALIVAMLVSTAVAWDNRTLLADFHWRELLGTLFSVEDVSLLKPGVIADPYLGNDPLWSLSYEVAFYVVFPLVLRAWTARPAWTNHAVGLVCCLAYATYALWPNHLSLVTAYFLVWWCGAMAADAYFRGGEDVRAMAAPFAWLIALCGLAAAVVGLAGFSGPGLYPFLPLRHFAVAAAMLAALFSPLGRWLAALCARWAAPAAYVASISYGLYVLHFPILVQWRRASGLAGTAMAFAVLVAAAVLADRQLNRWLPRAPAG